MGSGVILTSNGYILSNSSLTGKIKSTCYVTLKNGSIYPAEVVWSNTELDISIIKIAADNLLALSLGDSDRISLGEKIYCLSNSTGFDFSEKIEEGIISNLNTTLKIIEDNDTIYVEDVIRLNFNIESENTGAPILNENGEILGIASSKINAVIPINRIKNILNRFKEDGNFLEPYLGIYGFDNQVIQYLNLDYKSKIGVYIEKVDENSPVYNEIFQGDIITKIDNFELSSMQELSEYLYTKNPKDEVVLQVIRGTKQFEISCQLKNIPA